MKKLEHAFETMLDDRDLENFGGILDGETTINALCGNRKVTKAVDRLVEIFSFYDIELVSYGLAPNPFGFCYEKHEELSEKLEKELNTLLNGLSTQEEKVLKEILWD